MDVYKEDIDSARSPHSHPLYSRLYQFSKTLRTLRFLEEVEISGFFGNSVMSDGVLPGQRDGRMFG